MAAAQAGDSAAYQTLLCNCIPLIKSVARRRGVDADRIGDVVQDVLLTIHRARHTYDPSRSFPAWLCVIADRRAIDLLRRARRHHMREVHAPLAFESRADEAADPSWGLAYADAYRRRRARQLAGAPTRSGAPFRDRGALAFRRLRADPARQRLPQSQSASRTEGA
jgi:RNA polymerase sigma factor (sigma-70 family)